MPPKAGIFAGEVTTAAPADGAATLKQKGYQWMEYGNIIIPPASCNFVWDIATLTPDFQVSGEDGSGTWASGLILGTGVLSDDHASKIYLPNDSGNYDEAGAGAVSTGYILGCQKYCYVGDNHQNILPGPNVGIWTTSGTGTAVVGDFAIDGTVGEAGVLTDTDGSDIFYTFNVGGANSTSLLAYPITFRAIVKKNISATHWSGFYLGTDDGVNNISTYFNQATGEINIRSSIGLDAKVEVVDIGDRWEVYQQIRLHDTGLTGPSGLTRARARIYPAISSDGISDDVTATGSLVVGATWVYNYKDIGLSKGATFYNITGSGGFLIYASDCYIDLANHDNTEGGCYIEWRPLYSPDYHTWPVVGGDLRRNVEILSLNGASGLLYYDYLTQKLTATDGTNTATVDLVFEENTKYRLGVVWGDMLRVGVDSVWGTAVPYDGAFPTSTRIDIFRDPVGPNYWRELRGYHTTYSAALAEISLLMAG